MKKCLFSLLLLTGLFSFGQNTKTIDNAIEDVKKSRLLMDSIKANLKSYTDSLAIVNYTKTNELDLTTFTNQSSKAAKKAAIFRIGLGIGLLVLLIVGLRRNPKNTVN